MFSHTLVYLDTSIVPNKMLGHVHVIKTHHKRFAVEFNAGRFIKCFAFSNNESIKNFIKKKRIENVNK